LAIALTPHAQAVLEKRLLRRDAHGDLVEDAEGLFRRVARAVAAADDRYGDARRAESEEIFFDLLTSLRFLPNSPTLMNAGVPGGQLAGCFVLPIRDSMDSIYGTLRDTALIQKSGGGTGFSFSELRPKGDVIRSTRGVSSGPVSFMRLYDYSTQVNRLGGKRAGANMGVLRHDHPDILEFVGTKRGVDALSSFNISVMASDAFMHAIDRGDDIPLRFPAGSGPVRGSVGARRLFDEIVSGAWETGDPGLLFLDRINAANPTPDLGAIEATNPCGEQPLLAYESCNLGSIDVSRFVRGSSLDYDALAAVVAHAVHFLDNVLDVNAYPVDAVARVTLGNRKIGLGIMGFADLLIRLDIPYASEPAITLAEEVMGFVQEEAGRASGTLAERRGNFPAFPKSRFAAQDGVSRRNACVTSIAPTGTISLLAGCSSGIEPLFALSYRREVIGDVRLVDVHPLLTARLHAELPNPDDDLAHVRATGHLRPAAPEALRPLFATAHEIAPEWHVRIQAAFQRKTDTAVSKTINVPTKATHAQIAEAYRLAFETGCKGVTVFRDGCKDSQVLRAGVEPGRCPECGQPLVTEAACRNCPSCGFSVCMI
jgi:ribonucleoside-diphosphate reductase alpha chain